MLVNVTFSLSDQTVDRLRKAARRLAGGKKGAISSIVEAALQEHLQEVEGGSSPEEFYALRDKKEVARAKSLRELATKLENLKVDPRSVLILSSQPLPPHGRTGLRGYVD